MIGFLVGIAWANAFEWYAHKHVLHGIPNERSAKKERVSPLPTLMKDHWSHHALVRAKHFRDELYEHSLRHRRTRGELVSMGALVAVGALAAPVAPFFSLGVTYGAVNYWRMHAKAHLDPEWAKVNLPWHYDHHMRPNQDTNWCVTRPWFDYVMGTREPSSLTTTETNPLGMKLPPIVERAVNRLLPSAVTCP